MNNADQLKLISFFTAENIIISNVKKEFVEVIKELLHNIELSYGIDIATQIYKDHINRNCKTPNQLINKLAIVQHFRISNTKGLRMAIAINKESIHYKKGKDSYYVPILILIISPQSRPDLYLRVFSSLNKLFHETIFVDELIKLTNNEDAWNMFDKTQVSLPEYITANEIMLHPEVVIDENKNVQDAIDLFIHKDILYIPVVDKHGELRGEVSIKELMNVCLPRYILWMDDINPILNFESFRNLLQNENTTWLNEIMNLDIAIVQFDEPAINSAIQMTKLEVDHSYVLNGKKLMGIISLHYFANKILRE